MNNLLLSLCLLLVVLVASVKGKGGGPFRSAKASREKIENYERVKPKIKAGDDSKPYPRSMKVILPTSSEKFILILRMIKETVPLGFNSRYFNENGVLVKDTNSYHNCHYKGRVEGHEGWTVNIDACQGLQGEFGFLNDRDQFYHIEPFHKNRQKMNQLHVVYKDTEMKNPPRKCGHDNENEKAKVKQKAGNGERHGNNNLGVLELLIINDNAQYKSLESNLTKTVRRAIVIAHHISEVFEANFGIKIVLTDTITFTKSDLFEMDTAAERLLKNFRLYVENHNGLPDYDSALLLTGTNLNGDVVGLAEEKSVCRGRSSAVICQDGGWGLYHVIRTATHEMGHIFGLKHEKPECKKAENAVFFNLCEAYYIENYIGTEMDDSCLQNKPETSAKTPRCGNGMVEIGEACDCGHPGFCTNDCCNPHTCQVVDGAHCANGKCCDLEKCRYLPSGIACRNKKGECDVTDSCSGHSEECPKDVVAADGMPCASNTGYCFGGQCPTHDSQCNDGWKSKASPTACYKLNLEGGIHGNCGNTMDSYIPCSESHIMCGQLQCKRGRYRHFFHVRGGQELTEYIYGGQICKSYGMKLPNNLTNPGLVLEGTKCATGKVCHEQKCVPLAAAMDKITCPKGSNGKVCSGKSHGVCTSLGKCSCLEGFVPPKCDASRKKSQRKSHRNKAKNRKHKKKASSSKWF